ncbi:unnamed protein product [Phytophthora lilii]|uniref:Unnamed protein product n=1 Tax=Phytophthora lilii TaxID=2077276 RepID=A0A9W6X2Y0_9STRA|nr:unnamed protein product [Phytophthora lilii]
MATTQQTGVASVPVVLAPEDPGVAEVDGSTPFPVEDPVAVLTRSVRLSLMPVPALPVGRLNEESPFVMEDKLPIDGNVPPVRELKPARPLLAVKDDSESMLGRMPDVSLLGNRLVIEDRVAVESSAVHPVSVEKSRPES